MKHEHITSLMAFNANLQLAHWQADTRTSDHVTLGNLYEQMTDLTDQLAEVMMGRDGDRVFDETSLLLHPGAKHLDLLNEGMNLVREIRQELKPGEQDDLLNIVADISSAINRARYLLKV